MILFNIIIPIVTSINNCGGTWSHKFVVCSAICLSIFIFSAFLVLVGVFIEKNKNNLKTFKEIVFNNDIIYGSELISIGKIGLTISCCFWILNLMVVVFINLFI